MTLTEKIAANLQFLKRSRNYTREQACNFIGIGVRSWDSYMEGRARPSWETLLEVSNHFGVPVDDILRISLQDAYSVATTYGLERKLEQGPKLVIEK